MYSLDVRGFLTELFYAVDLTVASKDGECVCRSDTILINKECVKVTYLLPGVIIFLLFIFVTAEYVYHQVPFNFPLSMSMDIVLLNQHFLVAYLMEM